MVISVMKPTLPIFAAIALAILSPASAQSAFENGYLKAFGGAAALFDDAGSGAPVAGVALGARPSATSPWAAELELSRRDDDTRATGLMVNAVRDLAEVGGTRIYAGAGLGAMRLDEGGASVTNPAAQVMLGTATRLGGSTDFTLELRHLEAGDGPTSDASWTDVTAGIVFGF